MTGDETVDPWDAERLDDQSLRPGVPDVQRYTLDPALAVAGPIVVHARLTYEYPDRPTALITTREFTFTRPE